MTTLMTNEVAFKLVEDPRVRWRWGNSGATSGRRPIPTIIAIANQKGGVGKTTTAVNLASHFARYWSTLLVDLDAQGNATTSLGIEVCDGRSICEVLMEGLPAAEAIVETLVPRLSLVPASPALSGTEIRLGPMIAREYKLKRALEQLGHRYDYIFIDCPPALNLLTLNCLTAADRVVIPVQCEYLALEGLSELSTTMELVRTELNPLLDLAGIVMTMAAPRTRLSRQIIAEVRELFPSTFRTVIPRNVRVAEAPRYGVPLAGYAPRSSGARAYRALAEELTAVMASM